MINTRTRNRTRTRTRNRNRTINIPRNRTTKYSRVIIRWI